jgi:hypothetical protein
MCKNIEWKLKFAVYKHKMMNLWITLKNSMKVNETPSDG